MIFDLAIDSWQAIAARLGTATLVGLALGFEREWRGHDAGLRTHALVALSAAAMTISALLMADAQPPERDSDPLRAVQGLAQAIGFIAGGLIFVRGGDVRNMTTAASLWLSAAVGIAAGAGQIMVVILVAGIALLVLSLADLPSACCRGDRRASRTARISRCRTAAVQPEISMGDLRSANPEHRSDC